jgi:hypothetical protein
MLLEQVGLCVQPSSSSRVKKLYAFLGRSLTRFSLVSIGYYFMGVLDYSWDYYIYGGIIG